MTIAAVVALGVILAAAVFTVRQWLSQQQQINAETCRALGVIERNSFKIYGKVKLMASDIASISASLDKAQKTLDAIVASNPKPAQDLTAIQTQADSVAASAAAVATALGVTVPAAPEIPTT